MTANTVALTADALDALPLPIAVLDAKGVVVLVNRPWARLAQSHPGPLAAASLGTDYPGAWRDAAGSRDPAAEGPARAIEDVLRGARDGCSLEYPCDGSGGHRWSHLSVTGFNVGAQRHVVVALLAEGNPLGGAQDASRIRDEFIATLSHELRTPLQSVLGWAKILKQAVRDEPQMARAVAAIERNAQILHQLLNDTLDFSRITRGTLELDRSPVEMAGVIADVVESMRPAFAEKNVALAAGIGHAPVIVDGDPIRLQQIIWNLLANALKFTPTGGRVDVRSECRDGSVEVQVRDTGVGIAPSFLPFIFERYRQSGSTPGAGCPGLGLGLAIVRDLVELHGGTVAAESGGTDCGATFRVTLPIARPDQPPTGVI